MASYSATTAGGDEMKNTTDTNGYTRTAYGWNSDDELEFIKKIGLHAPELPVHVLELRKGYLQGILKRTDWNGLDRDRIISRASIL